MITEPAEKIYSTEYDPLKVEETGELDEKHLQLLKDMGAFGVMNIFTGEAKVQNFFPYPKVLSAEEFSFVEMITEPAEKIYSTEYDPLKVEETGELDEKHLQLLKDMGAFGVMVPPEYGGMGLNNTQYARLGEVTVGFDLGITIFLGAHQSIGYKGLLLYGNKEQKERYLPELASGSKIAAFALTEPSAGSDASGIKSRAVLSEDGKTWTLNGSKIYISNGGIADYFTVFAQTAVRSSSGEMKDKVTAFWVPRTEGVSNGPAMKKMGINASNTTEVFYDNVKVPSENVIGQVGDGFKVAMNILNNGRYGMVCGLSGTMRRAIAMATAHAQNRSQFGNKLASFTGIQEKIAEMSMKHYVTQSMAYMISGLMDNGVKDYHLEAALSKIYASEAAWYVVDETLQIFGGQGYMREMGIEKMLRDVRIFRIFEGTNEILRLFVALTGMQYVGGHLREIQRAMKNPVGNLGMIFNEGTRRIKRSVGLETPDIAQYVHPEFHPEAQQLAKNILTFSSSVEHLLIKYTQGIIHEQMLLNRLSNAAIDIYTSLVVLSRVTRALEKNVLSAEIEKNMAKVICSE
ncbi:PREDICTED: very long-chain specific acyl-CoA dehydrogenase, mitochondrial-like, partial [Rhagoletis zephyria]|uniref:very long-chain specific acyl-CoA dehydrogenase, mitochondrial-like n=1 Tax=Rhagoletis zephyria TaxID=28612 RepID=UPI0008112B90